MYVLRLLRVLDGLAAVDLGDDLRDLALDRLGLYVHYDQ